MYKKFKRALKGTFPSLAAYFTLIVNKDSFLHTSGWMQSLKSGYPRRPDGTELPWMNYSMISFLEKRLSHDHILFEYGSGYSTLFYSRLVRTVTSVEYDKFWHDTIKKKIPDNAKLILTEVDYDGNYCRSIGLNQQQYDVVIVDGRDRVNCVKQSIDHLTDRGVILLDDSQRDEYVEGIQYAKGRGFCNLDFEGLKPTGSGMHRTTLFYRRGNCLSI